MKSVVVGTAGHIDHGKSALVLALTGTDPDRLKEEKARGITIDLGFANLVHGGLNFAFIDVPGHERFVKNMLAGVGGIDLVVLVIAADESLMPQTREHFDICRLLRVSSGIVVITKSDLVDQETLALVRLETRELVAGSFLEGAPIVAVSSRTGEGLEDLKRALVDVAARVVERTAAGPTRLPIDRVFTIKGFGTVVTGTLVSGRVRPDEELLVAPGERRVKVRGVQVHGVRQAEVRAGQRAAINLGGVEIHDLVRGQSLLTPDAFEVTRAVDAAVEVLDDAKALKHGTRVRFHQGTDEILGRVALIGPIVEPSKLNDRGVPVLPPGARGFARLRLERPAVLTRGDRFILRAYSPPTTIAGGYVLDPRPPHTALRTSAALERAIALDFDPSDPATRAAADFRAASLMVQQTGAAGFPVIALASRAGIPPIDVVERIHSLTTARKAVQLGDILVAPAVVEDFKQRIAAMLADHHRSQPLSDGIPREEARERLVGAGRPAPFERALEELAREGSVVVRDRLSLTSHKVALTPEEERARAAIERAFRAGGLTPPDAAVVQNAAGLPAEAVERIVKLLQRQKILVRVDTLVFHDEALRRLKEEMAALKAAAGKDVKIDVSTFKERFAVTRKFAIPLLEYLDRERVTRRIGDARVLL